MLLIIPTVLLHLFSLKKKTTTVTTRNSSFNFKTLVTSLGFHMVLFPLRKKNWEYSTSHLVHRMLHHSDLLQAIRRPKLSSRLFFFFCNFGDIETMTVRYYNLCTVLLQTSNFKKVLSLLLTQFSSYRCDVLKTVPCGGFMKRIAFNVTGAH